jgi:uncharacterized membrane protein
MSLNNMKTYAVALGTLAVVTMMVLAVITGFKNTNLVDNTTATNFTTGLGYFGTFAPILAIAIVGVIVIAMFTKKKGGGL